MSLSNAYGTTNVPSFAYTAPAYFSLSLTLAPAALFLYTSPILVAYVISSLVPTPSNLESAS